MTKQSILNEIEKAKSRVQKEIDIIEERMQVITLSPENWTVHEMDTIVSLEETKGRYMNQKENFNQLKRTLSLIYNDWFTTNTAPTV